MREMMMNAEMPTLAEDIVARIEAAFAGVELGDGVSLHESSVIDDHGSDQQRREARRKDETKDWRRIPDELLEDNDGCLNFVDAAGFRFHLPAYMRSALRHYKTSSAGSINGTIYALHRKDAERTKSFTPQQNAAVRRFLKFMACNAGDHVDKQEAIKALEEVWSIS